jgi:hypothetical protein
MYVKQARKLEYAWMVVDTNGILGANGLNNQQNMILATKNQQEL